VPNGPTFDVRIDNGNPAVSVVTFDLLSGSVGDLVLDSHDTLAVNGALTAQYAALISGTLNVSSAASLINNGLLNNYGTIQSDGSINNNLGATLNNYASATFYSSKLLKLVIRRYGAGRE